ncbi:MAG: RNA polymerase-binding protein DksA, partial [Planktomarina sp.]|nr:RNA polymerase-binding protein DksA [Planktomarina sp.]MDT2049700.1 RNA polymerase-binding protein DksA [Planktomarina sp.]
MKSEVLISNDYHPSDDETFMNEKQVEYFRKKLLLWKGDLMSDSKDTIESLQDSTRAIPDISDRASEETDRALELRTRDRQRKLVAKIDSALRRIEEGEFGYCEETG